MAKRIGTVLLTVLIGLFLTSSVSFAIEKIDPNGKAISDATALIEKNPKDSIAYYKRGVAYLNKNDFNEAIENFTKAVNINPKYAAAFLERGYIYSAKKNSMI